MSNKNEKTTANDKVESFISRNRKIIISFAGAVLLVVIVLSVVLVTLDSNKKKGLAIIDSVEYNYVNNSVGLEDSEILARQTKAIEELEPLANKKNIVGVRANMLLADIAFQKKDFEKALNYYLNAAVKKNSYTYAEVMYNAGVCAEELGKHTDAITYYENASEAEDFYLASHAIFNIGRINEDLGNIAKASEYYNKVLATSDEWANLAQSRLIDLKAKGQID